MSNLDVHPVAEDLVTVQSFAEQYRVSASVVRGWIKDGHIDYVLVGPRKMRRISRAAVVREINPPPPESDIFTHQRVMLAQMLMRFEGLTIDESTSLSYSFSPNERGMMIDRYMESLREKEHGSEDGDRGNQGSPDVRPEGATGRTEEDTRRPAPDAKVKRRNR